jgi:hypothetical protein
MREDVQMWRKPFSSLKVFEENVGYCRYQNNIFLLFGIILIILHAPE